MKKRLLLCGALACAVMMISGCNTLQAAKTDLQIAASDPPTQDNMSALQSKLTSDLTAAIDRASKAKDIMAPQRVICYRTILSYVPNLPSLDLPAAGDRAGLFDAFEVGAELAENTAVVTDFQIPPEVRAKLLIDCGPVAQGARDLLLKFNIKVVRLSGALAILPK